MGCGALGWTSTEVSRPFHMPHQFDIHGTFRTPDDNPIVVGRALSVVRIMRSGSSLAITRGSSPLAPTASGARV